MVEHRLNGNRSCHWESSVDTGFFLLGFPGREQRLCLVVVRRQDIETDIGFGIEFAGAHRSIIIYILKTIAENKVFCPKFQNFYYHDNTL